MQHGSLTTKSRLEGPDVWQFRWSAKGPNGRRVYRKRVIGTIEEYPNQDAARSAVASLIAEVNWANLRSTSISMTVAQLCSHFEQRELARSNTWRSYYIARDLAQHKCRRCRPPAPRRVRTRA
jgi:integrase